MAVFLRDDIASSTGVVSCDWFAMSCKLTRERDGNPPRVPLGWSALKMSETAVWAERWFLMDPEGNKVATILCSPRSPKIPALSANVQIANRFLYYDDFKVICNLVLDSLSMVPCGLSRIDLCCDFEMSESMYRTYIALAKKDAKIKGTHESVSWWKDIPSDKRAGIPMSHDVPNQVNWGGAESTFHWKIYYKWLELARAQPDEQKPWILDTWRYWGLRERYVWRVEVSISHSNGLRVWNGQKMSPFEWYDNRVQLFQDLYADKVVIRRKEGHADRRNDTILPFLEVDGVKSVRHALAESSRDESDPERRLVCKLWSELQQNDTKCNSSLVSMLQRDILELCERPSNVWVLQRMFGVDATAIAKALDIPPLEKSGV